MIDASSLKISQTNVDFISLQYCAKVMQVISDEIPGFLQLFEEISFETIFC